MLAADSKAAAGVAELRTEPACSWKTIVEPVEPFLATVSQRLASQVKEFDPSLAQYAEYALNGNGKHLRPTLVALAANSVGEVNDSHATVAVIIEMVHLATLVHDDVMDEAEIRRGQLTLAAQWGHEIAVLFGDCLFAHALKLAASFPTPDICRAVASATNTVCAGEILQTQHRHDFARSRQEYFHVLEMKTAELFALSCELAVVLSTGTPQQRPALRQFGQAFGTAYQVYDDCVDLFGSEASAGKSLGTDLAKGKLTFPVLLAWERSTPQDREKLERLIKHSGAAAMPEVGQMLKKYETLTPSVEIIEQYLAQARQCIRSLPESGGRAGLLGITDYLARQTAALSE